MATKKLAQQDLLETIFSATDDDLDPNDSSAMTLIEHLEELRKRIFFSAIALVITSIAAFVFRNQIVYLLSLPLPTNQSDVIGHKLVVTGITEGFTVFLMISVAAGFIIALPFILYQLWAFISPGLLDKEKKYAVPFIVVGIVLFAAGITLGYIVLRYPVEWLVNFASASFTELVTAGSYFTFVAFFLLAFGIVFEIPLVLTFLAQIDIISSKMLIKKRAASHVGMWIASTFLTPGADLYSPIFLGVAMSCLFELTIIFIKIIKK